jgi:hypothetical protein
VDKSMEEKKSEDKASRPVKTAPDEVFAAIAAGIVLHRSGPGSAVALFGRGEHDEGTWGRSSRAGAGMAVAHRTRRDS